MTREEAIDMLADLGWDRGSLFGLTNDQLDGLLDQVDDEIGTKET